VLHKRTVPRESEHKGRDKNVKDKQEELSEHIRLGLGLSDFVYDLHFT
jgi:hypothetical protein